MGGKDFLDALLLGAGFTEEEHVVLLSDLEEFVESIVRTIFETLDRLGAEGKRVGRGIGREAINLEGVEFLNMS